MEQKQIKKEKVEWGQGKVQVVLVLSPLSDQRCGNDFADDVVVGDGGGDDVVVIDCGYDFCFGDDVVVIDCGYGFCFGDDVLENDHEMLNHDHFYVLHYD